MSGKRAAAAVSPRDRAQARAYLQSQQERWARGIPFEPGGDTLAEAIRLSHERQDEGIPDGEYVRYGAFKYPEASERDRWNRTRAILERIEPGPWEDANYIEILAREAAATELCVEAWREDGSHLPADVLERVLIGTTGYPGSEGLTAHVADHSVIQMSAGMIDLLYQSSKAIVLAWKRLEPPEGATVSFSSKAEDTDELLDADPYPVDLLFDTLAAWLYDGRSRASYTELPPPEYHPPLKLLINGSERFILAHEYGHALVDQVGASHVPLPVQEPVTPWMQETRADLFALRAVADSSAMLDLLPPNMALQGAGVAMKAHDVLRMAVEIARHGETHPDAGSPTHPPFTARLSSLEHFFVELHQDKPSAREALPGMKVPARTLDQLWARVEPRLRAQSRAGRELHPIWSMP